MIKKYKKVKSLVFELDGTLYPESPEINQRISERFAQKILDKKIGLRTLEEAIIYSQKSYNKTSSRSQILRELGFENVDEVMIECLSNTIDLIKEDREVVSLLDDLNKRYELSLLTASPESLSLPKLEKIGINPSIFDRKLYGSSIPRCKKTDGSIFRFFLELSSYSPNEHVYIGDLLSADIIPPKSLGMKTIIVGSKSLEADYSIKKIYDLRKVFL